jgi:uncharacterized membrane protein
VPSPPKRSELDHLAKVYSLDEPRVDAMLALSGARRSRGETAEFFSSCLSIGGILSLAAALVFFIAANWSAIPVFGRFALVQGLLVACAIVAIIKPPSAFIGRASLFLAFITTGVLLALFGQTYQTGADVHELFFSWTLLGLPFVFVARWSVTSAAWIVVLNVALWLFCGSNSMCNSLWGALQSCHLDPATAPAVACWMNLLLWFAVEWLRPEAIPPWVRRLLVTFAFIFATWSGVVGINHDMPLPPNTPVDVWGLLLVLLAIGAVTTYSMRRREDIYPLATVLGTVIIVGLAGLLRRDSASDEAQLLMCAVWLIGASALGGRWLVIFMRRWREGAAA